MAGTRIRTPSSQAKEAAAMASLSRPKARPRAKAKPAARSKARVCKAVQEQDEEEQASNDGYDEPPSEESSSEEDNPADEDFDVERKALKKGAFKSQSGSQKNARGKTDKVKGKRNGQKGSLNLPGKFSDDVLSMNPDDIITSQQRTEDFLKKINERSQTPDSPRRSADCDVPKLASEVEDCPFCNRPMPETPSERLLTMMQHWLNRLHRGEVHASTDTLEVCYRHIEESEIIPAGRSRGWIQVLDEEALTLRIRSEPEFLNQMRKRIDDPNSSNWYCKLKEMRALHGRKADGPMAQMAGLADMQAGYYGELGWETMRAVLVDEFIRAKKRSKYDLMSLAGQDDGRFRPLSAQDFIDKVLLPELVCMLIQDDENSRRKSRSRKITILDAKRIRDASQKYGLAMFPCISSVSLPGDESNTMFEKERHSSSKDALQQFAAPSSSQSLTQKVRQGRERRTTLDVDYDEGTDDEDNSAGSRSVAARTKNKKARCEPNRQACLSPSNKRPMPVNAIDSAGPSALSPHRPRPRPSAGRDGSAPSSSLSRKLETGDRIRHWMPGDKQHVDDDDDDDDADSFMKRRAPFSPPSLQPSSSQASVSLPSSMTDASTPPFAMPPSQRRSAGSSRDNALHRAPSSEESQEVGWFTFEKKRTSPK